MSIDLQGVTVRHERRIRLNFTNALASGAFGISPTYYTVTNLDGRGSSPLVMAALVVPGSTTNVELALGSDLARTARYSVSAVGVPAVDLSVTPAGSTEVFTFGDDFKRPNASPLIQKRDRILFGADLVWNESDFQEGSTGDLEQIAGTPNVTKALNRGLESDGLPHDETWGAHLREFVDSPGAAGGTMKGACAAQVMRDPRVEMVTVDVEIGDSDTFIHITPVLISGSTISRVTMKVPNGT